MLIAAISTDSWPLDERSWLGLSKFEQIFLTSMIWIGCGLMLAACRYLSRKRLIRSAFLAAIEPHFESMWEKPIPSRERHLWRLVVFKCCALRWTDGLHELRPVLRFPVGVGKNPHRRFRCHDDDVTKCQGVAGLAWAQGAVVRGDLPDNLRASKARRETYAKATHDDVSIVDQKSFAPRSMGAFRIDRKDGRRWGVIVLDCPDPDGVGPKIEQQYLIADTLGRLATDL